MKPLSVLLTECLAATVVQLKNLDETLDRRGDHGQHGQPPTKDECLDLITNTASGLAITRDKLMEASVQVNTESSALGLLINLQSLPAKDLPPKAAQRIHGFLIAELERRAKALGLEPADLDDAVHDAGGKSSVNNDGLAAQLEWLLRHNTWATVLDVLRQAKDEKAMETRITIAEAQ